MKNNSVNQKTYVEVCSLMATAQFNIEQNVKREKNARLLVMYCYLPLYFLLTGQKGLTDNIIII